MNYMEYLNYLSLSLPVPYRADWRKRIDRYDSIWPCREEQQRRRAYSEMRDVQDKADWAHAMAQARSSIEAERDRTRECYGHHYGEWRYPFGAYRGLRDRTCKYCEHVETLDSTG